MSHLLTGFCLKTQAKQKFKKTGQKNTSGMSTSANNTRAPKSGSPAQAMPPVHCAKTTGPENNVPVNEIPGRNGNDNAFPAKLARPASAKANPGIADDSARLSQSRHRSRMPRKAHGSAEKSPLLHANAELLPSNPAVRRRASQTGKMAHDSRFARLHFPGRKNRKTN